MQERNLLTTGSDSELAKNSIRLQPPTKMNSEVHQANDLIL